MTSSMLGARPDVVLGCVVEYAPAMRRWHWCLQCSCLLIYRRAALCTLLCMPA